MATADRALNIAFFIEGMCASGVDTSTSLLAKELRRRGHRVKRFVPWKDDLASPGKDEVIKLPAMRVSRKQEVYWTYPLNLPLFETFHQQQFDLIHIHTNTVINLLAWQMASAFNLPIVYTYHTMAKDYAHYLGPIHDHMGKLVDSAIESYDKLICERADIVVTPSAKAAHYLHKIGIPDVKIIPNGIDLSTFQPASSDWLRTRFRIPKEDKILLFVGRLNQEKRPLLAYDCFRRLAKKLPNLHLVMVGDGAQRDELLQSAKADKLVDRLHLTGLVNYREMPAVYNSADIWISTSYSEVHPMVAIEASACGLPAVCWRDEALTGVVEHDKNGLIVDTPIAFCNAIQKLLEDEALLTQMQQQATKQASHYHIENCGQKMLDLYKDVIQQRKTPASPLVGRVEKLLHSWQHRTEERLHELQ